MATDKKHIAVYLDSDVEQALIEFCRDNKLEGKKGPMYSAAVNKALAQYFGITPSSLPGNTLDDASHVPNTIPNNIPDNTLEQRLAEIEQRLTAQMAEMKAEILGEYAA
jgi:hypothetical protein